MRGKVAKVINKAAVILNKNKRKFKRTYKETIRPKRHSIWLGLVDLIATTKKVDE